MSSSDESFDQLSASEEEYKPIKGSSRGMSLRERNKRSYRELEASDRDSEEEKNPGSQIPGDMALLGENPGAMNEGSEFIKNDDSTTQYEEPGGVFYPDIDTILWRREKETESGRKFEFLVKYKEYSYLHVEWLEEQDIVSTKSGKNKLNRFTKTFEKKLIEQEVDQDDDRYFDPTYVEIDRVIYTTELFPIIHPKKSNEIKGKWTEYLVTIISKLLNFSKDNVHYGVYFMEPVNPDRDGIPNYKRIVTNPMDLGTIMNRLYLDFYKSPQQFWLDLGLVFRNCRTYFKDSDCDIRILCDTLCEVAIELYKQWYRLTKNKYDGLLQDFQEKQKIMESQEQEEEIQEKELIKRQTEEELKRRGDELHNFLQKFEKFQTQDPQLNPNSHSRTSQEQIFKSQIAQFITNNPIICSQTLNIEEILRNVNDPSVNFDTLLQQVNPGCRQIILENLQKNQMKGFPNKTFSPFMGGGMNQNMMHGAQNIAISPPSHNPMQMPVNPPINFMNTSHSNPNPAYLGMTNLNSEINNEESNNALKLEAQELSEPSTNNVVNNKIRKSTSKFKIESAVAVKELEHSNPGSLDFTWLTGTQPQMAFETENYVFIGEHEIKEIDLNKEVDKLYMVKWKNLSYLEATWEHESILGFANKINDFKIFNRSLDKEGRTQMLNKVQRHKTLLDLMMNPKKKNRLSHAYIQELKNKLYHYDVLNQKQPFKYTLATQPIYKERKLLRDYQLESLNWLIQAWYSKRNVILADEMGLGKTIQSIAFLNHLVNFENCRGPFLVIAPLSTLEHWKRTVEDWTNLNGVLYYDVNGVEGRQCCRGYEWFYTDISTKGSVLQSAELYKFHVLVTSNEVFLQDLNNVLLTLPFQYIVVDEAHRLKNQNAKILTALKRLPCKRILLLTGTPIQNNTEELWSLLNYIEPERFQKLEEFRDKFGDLTNSEQIDSLHKILKPFLLRRMKEDVEASIPPLQETIIDIELTTTQKTIYRALYEKNKSILSKSFSGGSFTTSLNNLEMQLRKCCNHPYLIHEIENECNKSLKSEEEKIQKMIEMSGKMILLDKLLPKMKSENKKLLIFSQFTYMLVLIEDYLKYKGYRFEKIDGTIKAKERQNSIDRFNNPDKKRDVFLLSTKAGGLGINLTSANVVIIFDSDWNPQNDVQATARAHRIGQVNEVQVYRLITARTYESEMLERATKKLGLDQAIFLGGAFQSTGIEMRKEDLNENKKMTKQEIETLLKKGILGLIEENSQQTKAFMEEDIEEILKKNSRIAKYSLINGTYSFSKSSFVSNQTDQNIKLDDPNFWEIVLKNTETQAKKLLNQLEKSATQFDSLDIQKEFMLKISDIVNQLIESKLNVLGYNADEETNIQEILNRILSLKNFHKYYRELATQWLYEIARPTRRFKKMTINDFDLVGRSQEREKRNFKQLGTMGKGDIQEEQSDYEQIYNENDENQGEGDVFSYQMDLLDDDAIKKKITGKEMEDRLKKLCNVCEKQKCTYFCEGFCKRAFHEICKTKMEENGDENPTTIPDDIHELKLDSDRLLKLMKSFTCRDCQTSLAICFKCKKKGTYIPYESKKERSKKGNPYDENAIESELTKCSTVNCNRFYHLSCISNNRLIRYVDANQQKFRCPLHYCNKCSLTGDSMTLIQCFRCPTSYHSKCCPKEKILKLSKKFMVCQHHNPVKPEPMNTEDYPLKRKKPSNPVNNASTLIKLPKFQDSLGEETLSNDESSPQNYKIKKKVDKFRGKEFEKNLKNNKNLLPSKSSNELTTNSSNSQAIKAENMIKLRLPNKKLSRKERMKSLSKKKPNPEPKFSYKDLGIPSPQDFNYDNYKKDWCRYCGTRFSGSFTKGPWGPRTLCTVHYIEWMQKKALNLSQFKEKPRKPINLKENRELSFISNKLKQNPEYNPKAELEEDIIRKKIKPNEDSGLEPGEVVKDDSLIPPGI